MTAINLGTDIPSQISTLEELAAWCAACLQHINGNAEVIEGAGYSERAAQYGIFYVPTNDTHRALIRLSLAVSKDWQAGGAKPWKFVQPLSNTAIPASFKTN